MKKIGLISTCILLSTQLNAHQFTHEVSSFDMTRLVKVAPGNRVDFSGTWVGKCSEPELWTVKIQQSDKDITTTFYDEQMHKEGKYTFMFNTLKSDNRASPKETNQRSAYAYWFAENQLSMQGSEITLKSGPGSDDEFNTWTSSSEHLKFVMEGEKLFIYDLYESSESSPCVFNKK